ncbi:hypothetical protein [Micromonospora sp. WMMD964]|uniref:hypothetical protein n=1 Tax=Micromonospora sp. WMMD964 TaxID=3016091 RepID=UPI00249B7DB6|nr:hypothetical protein [Micromonospora sp. WMMD964]WFE99609.1 hypothetical protein O7616_22300 [Micromonospora sp. WMMD964]
MTLAVERPAVRDERRCVLSGKITKNSAGKLGFNANNRQQSVDLARLDLADHLWITDPRPRTEGGLERDFDVYDKAALSFDNGRINILANEIMAQAGKETSDGIDDLVRNEQAAREIKKHLANHGWCSLLVALIQLIEGVNTAIGIVADVAKQALKDALSNHLNYRVADQLKDAVVDLVVDKVWSALARLLDAHFPLLGADTVRVLRMLAVFACPSVERHRGVYQHALVPLMGDGQGLVAEEVKAQVSTLFTAWWQRKESPTAP